MPVYSYRAMDARGKNVSGIIDAESEKAAKAKLRKDGKFPTLVEEVKEGKATRGKGLSMEIDLRMLLGRVKSRDLAIATRQFATLIGARIPMDNSLQALAKQVENPVLQKTFSQIRDRVTQGTSLANALREFPKVFPPLYTNMVAAGEESGTLEAVLARLADYTEETLDRQQKIKAAMTYPILMTVMAALIVSFLVVFVIPKLSQIFAGMNKALPPITMALLTVANFARGYWWLILAAMGAAFYAFRRWQATPKGRKTWDTFVLKTPIFGVIIRKTAVSRFSRTLATLLQSGVPIINAMNIVKNVVNNVIIEQAIEYARDNIREGQSIAKPLENSGVFPPMVIHMVAVGEQTGELEDMLFRIADAYDRDVTSTIQAMMSLLEPLILLVMAGVVLLIILSIMLPIMDMTSGLK